MLPTQWRIVSLKDITEIIMGQSPPSDTYNKEGTGLPFFQGKTEFGRRYPKIKMYCSSPKKTATENDILMSVRAPVGPVNIANIDCCIGRGLCAIRSSDKLDFMYLYHFLKTNEVKISSKGIGSTFTAINKKTIHELEIPLPPLQTQQKIVAILEKAERLKEWRKEADELTDEFLTNTFLEMFGNPIINPKKWDLKKPDEFCSKNKNAIKAGPFGSALKKEFYVESGYKIYGQEQVIKNDLNFGDYYISSGKYDELKNYMIQEGDVLISLVGSYGKIIIIPRNFEAGIINPRLMKITLNQEIILPIYFKHLFLSRGMKNRVKELSHGGTMDILNVGIVKKLLFPVPPLALQQKFASIVQQVEQLREHQSQSKQHIDDLFNVLMQKAFKGDLI